MRLPVSVGQRFRFKAASTVLSSFQSKPSVLLCLQFPRHWPVSFAVLLRHELQTCRFCLADTESRGSRSLDNRYGRMYRADPTLPLPEDVQELLVPGAAVKVARTTRLEGSRNRHHVKPTLLLRRDAVTSCRNNSFSPSAMRSCRCLLFAGWSPIENTSSLKRLLHERPLNAASLHTFDTALCLQAVDLFHAVRVMHSAVKCVESMSSGIMG